MSLSPVHHKMLVEDSRIAEALVQARGYQTLTETAALRALGFSAAQARAAPALAIPLWTVHGTQTGWQIRPDRPRLTRDGKSIKYENPKGSRLTLDVHPSVQPLLGDPTIPLLITEGVRKGDSLASHGQCAIALMGGVWGFRGTNEHGGKVVLPAWDAVALNTRDVTIIYDSDVFLKPEVEAALQALARFLRDRQAQPSVVCWPEAYRHHKVGVDDFFAQGGTLEEVLAMGAPLDAAKARPAGRAPAPVPAPRPPAVDPAADLGTVSPCTHVANARRLVRLYTPTLRYVLGLGWILWTGTFWRPDPTTDNTLATGFVSGLARSIAQEAATLYAAAAEQPSAVERKALYALAEDRGHWAVHSENASVIAGGLKLAKHDLLLAHADINPNPWLFNCHNGTIDLQTGTFRAHDPADLITHLAPVIYNPKATCPTWEKFLKEVFADDMELVAFLQRAIGWCLTGVVRDRALFFLYGAHGHNGKTTLVEILRDLLGTVGEESFGYARKVDVQTFMRSKNYEDNLRKAAQLPGARFVYSSETDEEHRLNEILIKDMTGGDTIEARRLYREAFTFQPTFKPWMYGNHKPEIRGTDDALWSRVKLVPFEVSFADRIDLDLPAKLRRELSGILNWAIAGCKAWQRDGLQTPEKVKAATATYRKEQDTIGQFILERCQTGEDYMQCKASRLYTGYRSWAEHNGHPVLSQKRFGTYLTAHNYPSDDNVTGTGASRKRISLTELPTDDEDNDEDAFSTLRTERVESMNASNGAAKPHSTASNSTLSTLGSRKSPIESVHERFSESKGRKGRNQGDDGIYPIENAIDTSTTLPNSKGRNTVISAPPPSCPGCARATTWLIRGSDYLCYKCKTAVPCDGAGP
jgi:putative DNA primase/helicase